MVQWEGAGTEEPSESVVHVCVCVDTAAGTSDCGALVVRVSTTAVREPKSLQAIPGTSPGTPRLEQKSLPREHQPRPAERRAPADRRKWPRGGDRIPSPETAGRWHNSCRGHTADRTNEPDPSPSLAPRPAGLRRSVLPARRRDGHEQDSRSWRTAVVPALATDRVSHTGRGERTHLRLLTARLGSGYDLIDRGCFWISNADRSTNV